MATSNLENQLHSAQKNLLFLQREHASTLKGLHAEIRRLQQHCTGSWQGAGSLLASSHNDGGTAVEPITVYLLDLCISGHDKCDR